MTDPHGLSGAEVRDAVDSFAIDGVLLSIEPLERGHIHDTFVSTWKQKGGTRRFLHQHMNDKVFQDLPALMHNIELVSRHLRAGLDAETDDGFTVLDLVPTREDRAYLVAGSGPWRTYRFIERTTSHDHCPDENRAYEAARAFGWFQARLADLDARRLRETLPKFFSTAHRLQQFDDALAEDPLRRAALCAEQIAFVESRRSMAETLEALRRSGELPLRTVHGDTKLNNVLFDAETGKARCIVDLDTCMGGWSLYDFGDLVRFTAATSGEDEQDLQKVGTDLGLYRAIVEGYLAGTRRFLTPREIDLMPFAARLVTFTVGLRFLTDYLAGDVYFKVQREEHNLDRARVQFRMVEEMERRAADMAVV
ncbi:MAG: N-acetylhexosamine 1-kinase [Planctomycetota bacterium]